MTVDDFLDWLQARADIPIEGCTQTDIDQLLEAQGVPSLPPPYEAFLRACGRSSEGFCKGTVIHYPLLVRSKESMLEALRGDGDPFELGPRSFVFSDHGGYAYWYFPDVVSGEVWEWVEGHPREPYFRTFEDWLTSEVAYHEHTWTKPARWEDGVWCPPEGQFSAEPYRTLWPE